MVDVDNVIAFPACEAVSLAAKPVPILTGHDVERIETMRQCMQRAQLAARRDVDQACAIIAADRCASIGAFASALFALLSESASQRMMFYPPGAEEFSESEIWLSRLMRAVQHGQAAQARALIAWRIKPNGHRRGLFLVAGLVTAFTGNSVDHWSTSA